MISELNVGPSSISICMEGMTCRECRAQVSVYACAQGEDKVGC